MKKLLFSLFILAFAGSSLKAQDDKKIKMGIAFTPALSWLTPDNNKKMAKDGSVLKMGIGLVADFRLTDVIWFSTGIEYMGAGGKIRYGTDTAIYYYKDDAILSVTPAQANDPNSQQNQDVYANKAKTHHLQTRNYKAGYVHIPVGFKLKTKELGGITYYGQIGGDVMIRTSSKADDHVKFPTYAISGTVTTVSYTEADIKANKLSNEVNVFNAAAHVGAGLEFRLSGSTAIIASVAYRHGIMNFTNADTYNLLRYTATTSPDEFSEFPNGTKLRQVVLTVGIMF